VAENDQLRIQRSVDEDEEERMVDYEEERPHREMKRKKKIGIAKTIGNAVGSLFNKKKASSAAAPMEMSMERSRRGPGSASGGKGGGGGAREMSSAGPVRAAAPTTPATPKGGSSAAPSIAPKSPRPDSDQIVADSPEFEEEAAVVDYTKIPTELEAKFDELDVDGALRPTIINIGDTWTKRFLKGLLAEPTEDVLTTDQQVRERNRAFDLLDALTKSGALVLEEAQLHVFIAATHCFDKTLINTLVQDNVNPIEKVERSSLIVATTIHALGAADLVVPEQLERVATYSPMLIEAEEEEPADAIAPAKEKEKESVSK